MDRIAKETAKEQAYVKEFVTPKTKKKKKKEVDPNKPTQMTSFILYMCFRREQIRNTGITKGAELAKIVGEEWRNMSLEEKNKYKGPMTKEQVLMITNKMMEPLPSPV